MKLTDESGVTTTYDDIKDITISQHRIILGGTVWNVDSMTTQGYFTNGYRLTTRDKQTDTGPDGKPVIRPVFKLYAHGKYDNPGQWRLLGWFIVEKKK